MTAIKTSSRHLIIESAFSLFMKHGIRKVSVEEICSNAAISKMTFYRSFKNKLTLTEEILVNMAEEGLAQYDEIMARDIPFHERIAQVIQMKYERAQAFSKEFVMDLYNHQPALMDKLNAFKAEMMKHLTRDLKEAQRRGDIRVNVKLDFVLFMMNSIQEKLMNEEFLAIYPNLQEASKELTSFFFYGIMGEEHE